jgi:dTDP-4-dehydrorhamnose reductase
LKVLIIGAQGMAGHMIKNYVCQTTEWEVWHSAREQNRESQGIVLDVTNVAEVLAAIKKIRPDVVINAAGILNKDAERSVYDAIKVNSLFPHQLVEFGKLYDYRVIHISTDCVFSGERGDYTEADTKDGTTVYAQTKSLGEVVDPKNLTLRTSIIGPELKSDGIGLFHWFMRQKGEIQGYRQVYWNGVTTLELAKAVVWSIDRGVAGLAHLSSPQKIAKFELLQLLRQVFQRTDVAIRPYDGVQSDKSLVNTRTDFDYPVPSYFDMLTQLIDWMDGPCGGVYSYG